MPSIPFDVAGKTNGIRSSYTLCSPHSHPHRRLVHHDHRCGRCEEADHCTGCCCNRCHVRFHHYVRVSHRRDGRSVRRGASCCCPLAAGAGHCGTLGLERDCSSIRDAARREEGRHSLLPLAIRLLVGEEPSLGVAAEYRLEGAAATSWHRGRKEVGGRQRCRSPESYCSRHSCCCSRCCCCYCNRLVRRRCGSHLHHHDRRSLRDRLHGHGIRRGLHGLDYGVSPRPHLR